MFSILSLGRTGSRRGGGSRTPLKRYDHDLQTGVDTDDLQAGEQEARNGRGEDDLYLEPFEGFKGEREFQLRGDGEVRAAARRKGNRRNDVRVPRVIVDRNDGAARSADLHFPEVVLQGIDLDGMGRSGHGKKRERYENNKDERWYAIKSR